MSQQLTRVPCALRCCTNENTGLEDDPGLTTIQFWAGRVLEHASKAADYGVDGLFGIHWRTRALSPQFAALFRAGWNDTSLPASAPAPAPTSDSTPHDTPHTDSDVKAAAASFYDEWCVSEFGGGDGVPSKLVTEACKPFRYLDAQTCAGNCKSLDDYPSQCGDPGETPPFFEQILVFKKRVWNRFRWFTANCIMVDHFSAFEPGLVAPFLYAV
jgi:hypothetical protein